MELKEVKREPTTFAEAIVDKTERIVLSAEKEGEGR